MARHHILDGKGLDAAVRSIQRQVVLYYPSRADRDADLRHPWDGAVALYPTPTGALVLESWFGGAWHPITGGGDTAPLPPVTDHGALTGLADDDHPQYLMPSEVVAGAGVTVTRPGDGTAVIAASSTGVTAHGALTGLGADDHPQYLRPAEVLASTNMTVTANADGTVTLASKAAPVYQCYSYLAAVTPATAWTKLPAGAPQGNGASNGNAVVANGSIYMPWIGLYTFHAFIAHDRSNLGITEMSVKNNAGTNLAYGYWPATPSQRFMLSGLLHNYVANGYVDVWTHTTTGSIAGGNGESIFIVSSLF